MAVRDAREEVRPGQGAGIGVRDVDLHLADDDKEGRHRHGHAGGFEYGLEAVEVEIEGLERVPHGDAGFAQEQDRQERAAQHLDAAEDDPSRTGDRHGRPPRDAVGRGLVRKEPQVVHLLSDLRHQGHCQGECAAEEQRGKGSLRAVKAREGCPCCERSRILGQYVGEKQEGQDDPEGLGIELQLVDEGDAVEDQGDDDYGAYQVSEGERDIQAHFQGLGHDGGLDGEVDDGVGCVDEGGHRGAEVAEPRATGEQIDVHVVAGCIVGDGQPGDDDDDGHA